MLINFVVRRNKANALALSKHNHATVADLLLDVTQRMTQCGIPGPFTLSMDDRELAGTEVLQTLVTDGPYSVVTVDIT